jgi:DNA-directed RNA polymerase subunit L
MNNKKHMPVSPAIIVELITGEVAKKVIYNIEHPTIDDELLMKLKKSGKRLKEQLNITPEDIEKALKEVRQEWED